MLLLLAFVTDERFIIFLSVFLQLVSNGIVFLGVNIAGIFLHNVTDKAQRKTFIDTRNCIAARLEIQDENDKLVCTTCDGRDCFS